MHSNEVSRDCHPRADHRCLTDLLRCTLVFDSLDEVFTCLLNILDISEVGLHEADSMLASKLQELNASLWRYYLRDPSAYTSRQQSLFQGLKRRFSAGTKRLMSRTPSRDNTPSMPRSSRAKPRCASPIRSPHSCASPAISHVPVCTSPAQIRSQNLPAPPCGTDQLKSSETMVLPSDQIGKHLLHSTVIDWINGEGENKTQVRTTRIHAHRHTESHPLICTSLVQQEANLLLSMCLRHHLLVGSLFDHKQS